MLVRLACGALHGVDAFRIDLEVDLLRRGMPSFTMVGLAEGAVREAKERVFAAIRTCGFKIPPSRITVNLAPADRPKAGSAFDLPLAIGLLASSGLLAPEKAAGWFMAGELSLAGNLRPVPGVLPLAILARDERAKGLLVPPQNSSEASIVEGLPVYAPENLVEAIAFLDGRVALEPARPYSEAAETASAMEPGNAMGGGNTGGFGQRLLFADFSEVKGQLMAKRSIEVAAAGSHNLLFIGPPGSGKSMLAQRIPGVLPPPGFDEALEITKIYSVAGKLPINGGIVDTRPFRAPHHTVSEIGLIGGGNVPRPGEVSLAHRGVLFLDELPEYKKQALEVLRQPLENGEVTITRSSKSVTFPAACMLVAAMNPCPCGYYGDLDHICTCAPGQVERYRNKISGPLLDRIDMHVEVPAVPYEDLSAQSSGPGSADMRARIVAARNVQHARYKNLPCSVNGDLSGNMLEKFCALGPAEQDFMGKAVKNLGLSARSYTRILRLARTIADLGGEDGIKTNHLAEAVSLRVLDRERR